MARKEKKRGTTGHITSFISRRKALAKLQLTLKDFRRLCILKGIYPVEPRFRRHVNHSSSVSNTFYLVKDIQFLSHEPIIQKFRDFKVFIRRLRKAIGKNERDTAEHIRNNEPVYRLDHIVKERYPSLIDAIRDMDDALSMCFLFSTFPHGKVVKPSLVGLCRRVTVEFLHYVLETRALRKVFISIKGFYYQAEVMGQPVTWIVPHAFSFQQPADVDFKIMATFTDFYVTLLGCINYKLYNNLNLYYPPKLHLTSEDQEDVGEVDEEEGVVDRIASLTEKLKSMVSAEPSDDAPQLDEFPDDNGENTAADMKDEEEKLKKFQNLFEGLKVFLNREVPREPLTFVLRALGAEVSWCKTLFAGATFSEDDLTITHQIVDRPSFEGGYLNRYYVQPQWVFDCVNYKKLLPVEEYFPGVDLPPHLSPFVEEKEGDYVPPEKTAMLQGKTPGEMSSDDEEVDEELQAENEESVVHEEQSSDEEAEDDASEDEELEGEEEEDEEEIVVKKTTEKKRKPAEEQKESESKKSKMAVMAGSVEKEDAAKKAEKIASEEKRLAVMMIPKKRKHLYDKIVFGQKRKRREVEHMKKKREEIDKPKQKAKKQS
ncbi:pescadillo homolog [Ornithodoros turicata]|uniref:pescadillo homolog n=1 Tax=Ornithodoros turicata TaxID=34597 RepID=UPI003139C6CF